MNSDSVPCPAVTLFIYCVYLSYACQVQNHCHHCHQLHQSPPEWDVFVQALLFFFLGLSALHFEINYEILTVFFPFYDFFSQINKLITLIKSMRKISVNFFYLKILSHILNSSKHQFEFCVFYLRIVLYRNSTLGSMSISVWSAILLFKTHQ